MTIEDFMMYLFKFMIVVVVAMVVNIQLTIVRYGYKRHVMIRQLKMIGLVLTSWMLLMFTAPLIVDYVTQLLIDLKNIHEPRI